MSEEITDLDRVVGAVVGGAVCDALGAGYEFDEALEPVDARRSGDGASVS